MRIVLAYLALLVLIVACAENTSTDTQASESAQENANENSAVVSVEKEFESLFAKRNQEWKIAYDLTSTMDGEQQTMKMTQYLKGENIRMDTAIQGMESRTYIVNDVFTMCTKQDAAWQCFKSGQQVGDDTVVSSTEWEDDFEEDATKYDILSDGTKQVAGVTAKCYKIVEQGNADAVVRYCFSSDGAPLYMYFSDDSSSSEMIATSYSKSVANSDFTPPAEAQDISAMYGGAGGTYPSGGDYCDFCNQLTGTERDECLASC